MKKVIAIYRAEKFSPNSVEKDKAIMDAVCSRLQAKGHEYCNYNLYAKTKIH